MGNFFMKAKTAEEWFKEGDALDDAGKNKKPLTPMMKLLS